jgi:hypothetical protein
LPCSRLRETRVKEPLYVDRERRTTPKAVALALIPALVLTIAFAFSYVGAFHDPTPHQVPLAVVGPPEVVAQLDELPGDPLDRAEAGAGVRSAGGPASCEAPWTTDGVRVP